MGIAGNLRRDGEPPDAEFHEYFDTVFHCEQPWERSEREFKLFWDWRPQTVELAKEGKAFPLEPFADAMITSEVWHRGISCRCADGVRVSQSSSFASVLTSGAQRAIVKAILAAEHVQQDAFFMGFSLSLMGFLSDKNISRFRGDHCV